MIVKGPNKSEVLKFKFEWKYIESGAMNHDEGISHRLTQSRNPKKPYNWSNLAASMTHQGADLI